MKSWTRSHIILFRKNNSKPVIGLTFNINVIFFKFRRSLDYTTLFTKKKKQQTISQTTSWLFASSLSLKNPFSVLHSRIVTVFRLTVTSVINTWSATGLRDNQYSDPGLVKTGNSRLLLLCPFTVTAAFTTSLLSLFAASSCLVSFLLSVLGSSVRDATGLGDAGSLVDVWGRVGSTGVRALSAEVLGAVAAVKTAGLEADGMAEDCSSSLFRRPLVRFEDECCLDEGLCTWEYVFFQVNRPDVSFKSTQIGTVWSSKFLVMGGVGLSHHKITSNLTAKREAEICNCFLIPPFSWSYGIPRLYYSQFVCNVKMHLRY